MAGEEPEAVARRILAAPPAPPRDPGLFTSGALFGQPGIYPGGPPMAPAPVAAGVAAGAPAGRGGERDLPAAALALLAGTVAAPLARAFPRRTAAGRLSVGVPAAAGRVVGPPAAPAGGDGGEGALRVVNARYAGEDPALVAPSLAHDLLWLPSMAVHGAETLLHALAAMVHVQLVAGRPSLAHLGTELCRRQNSLAVTLCNSRRPGSWRITLVAPDGPGTIPGGDPAMTTPDFWSVPFGPPGERRCRTACGRSAPRCSARWWRRPMARRAVRLHGAVGPVVGARLGTAWLGPLRQLRAAVALGLVRPEAVVAEAGRPDAVAWLGLTDAAAAWER